LGDGESTIFIRNGQTQYPPKLTHPIPSYKHTFDLAIHYSHPFNMV